MLLKPIKGEMGFSVDGLVIIYIGYHIHQPPMPQQKSHINTYYLTFTVIAIIANYSTST